MLKRVVGTEAIRGVIRAAAERAPIEVLDAMSLVLQIAAENDVRPGDRAPMWYGD